MTGSVGLRAAMVVFLAALFQAVVVPPYLIGAGAPDVLLLVVVSLGLLRGSVAGALLGFTGGLVIDLLTLDTLGFTSLVLTLAGFWAGRYAETTGHGRRLAPLLAVGAITVLATVFAFVLHYMLGDDVVARHALFTALVPMLLLNLLLALPVHALVRRAVGEQPEFVRPAGEVEVVV